LLFSVTVEDDHIGEPYFLDETTPPQWVVVTPSSSWFSKDSHWLKGVTKAAVVIVPVLHAV
jgi:hypothetical protein